MNNHKEIQLNNNHWRFEDYRQRMTKKEWEEILLNYDDKIIVRGELRQLVIRKLSSNVIEVYKKPL